MSRSFPRTLTLAFVAALGGCNDSTAPPVPTTVTISAASTTFQSLGETLQLGAQVKDQKGRAMSGIGIIWSSSNEAVAQVAPASGLVTAVGQGSVTVSASAQGALGTIVLTVTQKPTSLEKVRGDAQQGTVGEVLQENPTVKVLDSRGNPIPTVSISYAVSSGGGLVSSGSVQSDPAGEASVAWTMGTDAKLPQRLTASVEDVAAEFSATALAGPMATLEAFGGNGQSSEALQPLAHPLAARVLDRFGNPVAGVPVQWTPGSGSGSLAPETDTTDVEGISEAAWTLGALIGVQRAEAAAGSEPVSFSATATAPPIADIVVTPPTPFLVVGEGIQLSAAAFTATGVELLGIAFDWGSSDPGRVSVSQGGYASALGSGQATVSAQYRGAVGSALVSVSDQPQQTGIRLEVPASASSGETVQASLILETAGISHAVGAVATTIEWSDAVLTLGSWTGFSGDYAWSAVRSTSTGRLGVVVSVPEGLTGEVILLQFPLQVTGASGSQTSLSLSVDGAISAHTFLEIGSQLPAFGALIRVNGP